VSGLSQVYSQGARQSCFRLIYLGAFERFCYTLCDLEGINSLKTAIEKNIVIKIIQIVLRGKIEIILNLFNFSDEKEKDEKIDSKIRKEFKKEQKKEF